MEKFVFFWPTMVYGLILTKRLTRGRLHCNWFTAAIVASMIIGFYLLLFWLCINYFDVSHKGFGQGLQVIPIFLSLMSIFPFTICLTFLLCTLFLPGFRIRPPTILQEEYQRKKRVYTTRYPELNNQLYKILPVPGKASVKQYIREIAACAAIYYGLLFASGVLSPYLSFFVLFLISKSIEIQEIPSSPNSTRFHSRYDVFNPNSYYNRHHPFHRRY